MKRCLGAVFFATATGFALCLTPVAAQSEACRTYLLGEQPPPGCHQDFRQWGNRQQAMPTQYETGPTVLPVPRHAPTIICDQAGCQRRN
jgi:hypothetical protein